MLRRLFGIMPAWCWFFYIVVAPIAVWVFLTQRALMWDAASDWRHLRWLGIAIGLTLIVALVIWSALTTTKEHGERLAARHGKRAAAFIVGLLATGTIAGGIAINLASARVDGYLNDMQPSVNDFYHNHDTTRLAGRTIKMIILKSREKAPSLEVRFTMTRIANHVPKAWDELAKAQSTLEKPDSEVSEKDRKEAESLAHLVRLILGSDKERGVDDKSLAAYLLQPDALALGNQSWLTLLDHWTTEIPCEPLPDETLEIVATRLHQSFASAMRESAKYAWQKGDRAWPALQIDMGRLLIEDANRGVRRDDTELRTELAQLHDEAQCLQDLVAALDRDATSRHQQLITSTGQILDQLDLIKASLAGMDKKLDLILAAVTPRPAEDNIEPPKLTPDQESSLREVYAGGNPLQQAIAAVALASASTGSARWENADAALREVESWKSTGIAWTPGDECRLLMAKGDRLLYDGDIEGANTLYQLAMQAQPMNAYATTRASVATTVIQRRTRPVIIEEQPVIVRRDPVYVPAPSVPWHQGLDWDPLVATDTSSALVGRANDLVAGVQCKGCSGKGTVTKKERVGENDRDMIFKEPVYRTVTRTCPTCNGGLFDSEERIDARLEDIARRASATRPRTDADAARFDRISEKLKEALVNNGREAPTLNNSARALFASMDINSPTPVWFSGTVSDRVELGQDDRRAVAMRIKSNAGRDVVVVDPIADSPAGGTVYVFGMCTKVHDAPGGQMPVVQSALVVSK